MANKTIEINETQSQQAARIRDMQLNNITGGEWQGNGQLCKPRQYGIYEDPQETTPREIDSSAGIPDWI